MPQDLKPPPQAPGACWQQRLALEERLGLNRGAEEDFRNRVMAWKARVAVFGLRCAGLFERGRRNTRDFEFESHTFHFSELPAALDGFRILHLSDFHFSRFDPEFADAVIALLDGREADICLITGDYRYGYFGPCDHIYPVMARILDNLHLRHGAYGTLGNHDISDLVAPLEKAGLRMLLNRGELVRVGETALWIGGVDDAHFFRAASVPGSLAGAPADAFKILLAHTPENVEEAAALGYDFCLCGHTHGGQICLPLIGALQTNARCKSEYAMGKWRHGNTQGYTTRGLGTTDVPLRFNCTPEATQITLRQG